MVSFANTKAPAHLVEAAADVVGLAVLFTADNGDVRRDVLAIDKDPGCRTARAVLVVVAGAVLGIVQPVLQSPDVRLFL